MQYLEAARRDAHLGLAILPVAKGWPVDWPSGFPRETGPSRGPQASPAPAAVGIKEGEDHPEFSSGKNPVNQLGSLAFHAPKSIATNIHV